MPVRADLVEAIKQRDAGQVRAILQTDPQALQQRAAGEESPVQTAAYYGATDVLAELLPHATLDIFEATVAGYTPTVEALLAARPSAVADYSYDGWTALHLAGFFGQVEIARRLLAAGADVNVMSRNEMANQPLHAALAGKTDEPTVEVLLAAGAEVNRPEHGGYTPLHLAASRGNRSLVDRLLALGACAAGRSDDGQTAAELAATRSFSELADYLRSVS